MNLSTADAYRAIGKYSFEEFIEMARLFHNYPAPGLLVGGYMVTEALRYMPEDVLYEAISETSWCLPDAIQMLTPCTIGNGWMRVMNFGIYGMSLYDKFTGEGVRVWLDLEKIPEDSEIRVWFLKAKPKKDQDSELLRHEIGVYGPDILSIKRINVAEGQLVKRSKGDIAICPRCNEAYPVVHGTICRSCRGESPYLPTAVSESVLYPVPEQVKILNAEEAVGKEAAHDMTQIIPGEDKGAAFRRGHTFDVGDLCRLQQMGKNRIFIQEDELGEDWVHEDECAKAFAEAMSGSGVTIGGEPHEGKVTLKAESDGLLVVDRSRLNAFNLSPGVMSASRKGWTVVRKGAEIAGTRAIPLYMQRSDFTAAMRVLDQGPIFKILPMKKAKVGILITGNEVFDGTIEDRFEETLRTKLAGFECSVVDVVFAPDERDTICNAALKLQEAECDLIITTAGLSVDPDDLTRHGLVDAGARDLIYGAPILPGAMTLLGKIGNANLIGVPACALFFKRTSFDLLLPRLLSGVDITRADLAEMGDGGMCLGCTNCTFPKCSFGK
ncbi:trehalose-binding protein [Marinifilum sp. JC120]|nr:trehalose-binding protein [Marinifilum sp. JC120]